MAQSVGHHENSVIFKEGPFVISNPYGNGWRIEVELKGHPCPVLPDSSIYRIGKALGLDGKTRDQRLAAKVCDTLNRMVVSRAIVLRNGSWILAAS